MVYVKELCIASSTERKRIIRGQVFEKKNELMCIKLLSCLSGLIELLDGRKSNSCDCLSNLRLYTLLNHMPLVVFYHISKLECLYYHYPISTPNSQKKLIAIDMLRLILEGTKETILLGYLLLLS